MNRTATMSAPPHDPGQSAGRNNPPDKAKSPRTVRVLVVDDSEVIRALVAMMLHTAGYTVLLAENGREALAQLRENAVEVVVTDMIMPEMDGLELIAALRTLRPELPVIAMSGGSDKSDSCLARAKELGARSALAKPFQVQQMLEAVARALPAPPR
jgi:CheY-like chemotaxis protein